MRITQGTRPGAAPTRCRRVEFVQNPRPPRARQSETFRFPTIGMEFRASHDTAKSLLVFDQDGTQGLSLAEAVVPTTAMNSRGTMVKLPDCPSETGASRST